MTARQLLTGPGRRAVRADSADWWVLARHGRIFAPTADGEGLFLFVTDRGALVHGLADALLVHLRLLVRWRSTAARYRAAAQELVSPEAWSRRFAAPE
jgi:galactofuranosylgalactofuranosylrhamnosyl-N-acetylglucosaminyl-diphospho-decaprenol beta-1,5/1,6-galactofuranosyltransferase